MPRSPSRASPRPTYDPVTVADIARGKPTVRGGLTVRPILGRLGLHPMGGPSEGRWALDFLGKGHAFGVAVFDSEPNEAQLAGEIADWISQQNTQRRIQAFRDGVPASKLPTQTKASRDLMLREIEQRIRALRSP